MFLVVGVIGAVLLIFFLVFDDVLDGLLPDTDWISGPIIGAFLAAFGVVGWTATAGFDAPEWLASIAGVAGGVGLGYLAYLMMKVLVHSPTDATMTPAALVGREGRVITAAGPGQLGEVLVTMGGQPLKLTAVSDDVLARGSQVVVIDVASPTKVVVELTERFWAVDPASTTP